MVVKEKVRKLGLFAVAALIVGSIGQGLLEWSFLSDPSTQAAISFARSSQHVTSAFGEVHNIKVMRVTDYRNAARNRREREYIFYVDGSIANGTVEVTDIAPKSAHRYEIGEVDAYRESR